MVGCLVGLVMLFAGIGIGSAQTSENETAELSVGSFLPSGLIENHFISILPETLEQRHPGMFDVEFAGGPETFPPFELFSFVRRGAVDMGNVPTAYYSGEIPVAQGLNLPLMPAWEWREHSIQQWAEEVHEGDGIKYLGQTEGGISYHCYTKERVESPEDFEGMSIRTTPNYRPLLERFGADAVQVPPPEIYTALERGVIDGFCWPAAGAVLAQEWHKEVNYVIDPGFYQVELALIMDLDRWEQLSSAHQEALMDTVEVLERQTHYYFGKQAAEERIQMRADGLEVIEFTGEARERWERASFEEFWKLLLDTADREDVEELNRLLQDAGQETYFPEDYEGS